MINEHVLLELYFFIPLEAEKNDKSQRYVTKHYTLLTIKPNVI